MLQKHVELSCYILMVIQNMTCHAMATMLMDCMDHMASMWITWLAWLASHHGYHATTMATMMGCSMAWHGYHDGLHGSHDGLHG
jgi:hypothetical protein